MERRQRYELCQVTTLMNFLNEVTEHALGCIEVSNNTIFQRANCNDIARRAADHALRFNTNRKNCASILVNCYNRWLIENNAASTNIDKCVCCSKIDSHITPDEVHTGRILLTHFFTLSKFHYFTSGNQMLISRFADSTESEP